jgi:hypothetical protein
MRFMSRGSSLLLSLLAFAFLTVPMQHRGLATSSPEIALAPEPGTAPSATLAVDLARRHHLRPTYVDSHRWKIEHDATLKTSEMMASASEVAADDPDRTTAAYGTIVATRSRPPNARTADMRPS